MDNSQPIFITATEMAELFNVKVGTIYSWLSYKQLPADLYRKLGRKPIFIRAKVIEWFMAGAILTKRTERQAI
ncbi:MAG: helix-turn-helix domain-containing protein [Candidatus Gastranaerophilales bacterium]|nr:helix-turn-helix domain-containing protein [Candidatus Gastranaerophilales bacterium]